jgi:hypothetical protein
MSRRRLGPPEVLEHQHAREQHRTGVDLVLAGVLRGGAVRRLEDAVTGDVVDVAARSDADAADLGGQRVGEVVAVQVGGGDDVELAGRVNTCCNVMSAMASLTRILSPGLPPQSSQPTATSANSSRTSS